MATNNKPTITYDMLTNEFLQHYSDNTKRVYKTNIRIILNHLGVETKTDEDLRKPLSRVDDILEYIKGFKTLSTRKSYLSVYIGIAKKYDLVPDRIKSLGDLLRGMMTKANISQSIKAKSPEMNIPIAEAQQMMTDLKGLYDDMLANLPKDKYTHNHGIVLFLHLVLNYGVLRPSELTTIVKMQASREGLNTVDGNGTFIIRDHKTKNTTGDRSFKTDKTIRAILKQLPFDGSIIKNTMGTQYSQGQGFDKQIRKLTKKRLGREVGIYDMRRAKASIVIDSQSPKAIEKLEVVQGHNLNSMIQHYQYFMNHDNQDKQVEETN